MKACNAFILGLFIGGIAGVITMSYTARDILAAGREALITLDTGKRPVTIPDQGAGQFAVASEAEGGK